MYLVEFKRDDEAGDTVAFVQGERANPKKSCVRKLGVVATCYVTCALPGAQLHEHQHECDALVDALITSAIEWGVAAKVGVIEFAESRYLTPEEIDGGEHHHGVVYRLRFEVPRGVSVRDYEGAARPEAAFAKTSLVTRVTADGTDFEELP
jgi:hypothetical protein